MSPGDSWLSFIRHSYFHNLANGLNGFSGATCCPQAFNVHCQSCLPAALPAALQLADMTGNVKHVFEDAPVSYTSQLQGSQFEMQDAGEGCALWSVASEAAVGIVVAQGDPGLARMCRG